MNGSSNVEAVRISRNTLSRFITTIPRKLRIILLTAILSFIVISICLYRLNFVESQMKYATFILSKPLPHSTSQLCVHQTWKTAILPPRLKMWAASWKKCFPTATYNLWTDADNRVFIKRHYSWFLSHYDSFPKNIQRVDAVRYFYMFHYGGIYADLDTECLKPFTHLIEPYRLVFGAMEGGYPKPKLPEGHVQNSFMYSKPGELFWIELVKNIMNQSIYGRPEESTGPDVLMNTMKDYRHRIKTNNGLKIYAPSYFNPISWIKGGTKCKTFNTMSDVELSKCRQLFVNESFVIQYHAHMWDGGSIL